MIRALSLLLTLTACPPVHTGPSPRARCVMPECVHGPRPPADVAADLDERPE